MSAETSLNTSEIVSITPVSLPNSSSELRTEETENNKDIVMASLILGTVEEGRQMREQCAQAQSLLSLPPPPPPPVQATTTTTTTTTAAAAATTAQIHHFSANHNLPGNVVTAAALGRRSSRPGRNRNRYQPIAPTPYPPGHLGAFNYSEPWYPGTDLAGVLYKSELERRHSPPYISFHVRQREGERQQAFFYCILPSMYGKCLAIPVRQVAQGNILLLGLGTQDVDSVAVNAIGIERYAQPPVRAQLLSELVKYATTELPKKFRPETVLGLYIFTDNDIANVLAP